MSARPAPPQAGSADYTIPEVAFLLHCSVNHVYRLIDASALECIDTSTPGSKRSKMRVTVAQLAAYRKNSARPVRKGLRLGAAA